MIKNLVEKVLESMADRAKRIVVIGDTLTDVWVDGRLDSCQDCCLKFVGISKVTVPGGAANAERSLGNWVHRTSLDVALYGYDEGRRPVKTRFVVDGKIIARWDDEERVLKTNQVYYAHRPGAGNILRNADAVLLSDYDKGYLTPELISTVLDLCRVEGIPCIVDAKRHPSFYEDAIIKCNVPYSEKWQFLGSVCTDGHRPPLVLGERLSIKSPAVICANHVGAGDCFAAHLTLGMACGLTLWEASILAHSAGRVYVQYEYNRPPRPEEIMADLEKY